MSYGRQGCLPWTEDRRQSPCPLRTDAKHWLETNSDQRTCDKGLYTEEPCAGKLASTVLKQRGEGRLSFRL